MDGFLHPAVNFLCLKPSGSLLSRNWKKLLRSVHETDTPYAAQNSRWGQLAATSAGLRQSLKTRAKAPRLSSRKMFVVCSKRLAKCVCGGAHHLHRTELCSRSRASWLFVSKCRALKIILISWWKTLHSSELPPCHRAFTLVQRWR